MPGGGDSQGLPWPVIDSLSAEQVEVLMGKTIPKKWLRGEALVFEGGPDDRFFLVEEGQLGVTVSTRFGDSVLLAVLTRGDSFGELALIDDNAARSATVIALSDSRTRSLSRPDFLDLRARHPNFDRAVTAILAGMVRRLSRQVLESRLLDAESKVRRQLRDLAITFTSDNTAGISTIPLTQEEIAQLAGVGRQAANTVMKKLEREGLLRLGRGSVEIAEPEALVVDLDSAG